MGGGEVSIGVRDGGPSRPGDRPGDDVPSSAALIDVLGGQITHQVLDTWVHPVVLLEGDGTIAWAGASITELLGHPASDLAGHSMLDLVEPTDRGRMLDALAAADARARAGGPDIWEAASMIDLTTADGRAVRCQVSAATPSRTGLDHLVVQLRQAGGIGWLHEALAAMAEGADLRTVVTHLVAMTELDLPSIRLSVAWDWDGERFRDAEGGPSAIDLTRPWGSPGPAALAGEGGQRVELASLPHHLAAAAAEVGATEVWLCHLADRRRRAVVAGWHVAPWYMTAFAEAALERTARLVGMAVGWDHDRRALGWAARHDALTGLPNRGAFLEDLARTASRPVTVLYLDLDDFKPVNDDHGHALGDRVLAEVATRLRSAVRPDDVVARLGGDEFAVLCPGLDDRDVAAGLARRLVEAVDRPMELDGEALRVGLSVGIAGVVAGHDDPEELLARADAALRATKAAGKRGWRHADRTDRTDRAPEHP